MTDLTNFSNPENLERALDSVRVIRAFSDEVASLVRSACALEAKPLGGPDWRTLVNDEEPVRKVRTRRGKGNLFIFASVKNDANHPIESVLEYDADVLYECDPSTRRFVAQPLTLRYVIGDKESEHTPDRLVWRDDGIFVDEIKPLAAARSSPMQRRAKLFRAFFRRYAIQYRVWTDADLRVQPRLTNCETLLGYAADEISAEQERAILLRLAAEEPATIAQLGEAAGGTDGESAVQGLVLRGVLRIDHRFPLARDSLVWRQPEMSP